MSIVMSAVSATLADDSSYDTYASLQVGSNGDTYGDPTQIIGDVYGEENYAFNTWDSNLAGGFEASDVPVEFDVKSDGSESLYVDNQSALTYQTGDIGSISSVVLEAAVQTNAEAKWSDVTVEFLRNGVVVETVDPSSGPDVNTISAGSSNVADQTLTITPSASNDDEAIVTGSMTMRSPWHRISEFSRNVPVICSSTAPVHDEVRSGCWRINLANAISMVT